MDKLKNLSSVIASFFLGILITSVVTFVYAHGGDINLIHSCVRNHSGTIRIIGANDTCNSSETPLDWNIQGVQGSPGSILPLICPGCSTFSNSTVENTLKGKNLSNSALGGSRWKVNWQ